MFDALRYYVNILELNSSRMKRARIKQLTESLKNLEGVETVRTFMHRQARYAEKELAAAIGKLL